MVSLDVFDTVLVRASGPPQALYLFLGNQLSKGRLIPCTPEVFARARAQAETDVWDRVGGLDAMVTLGDFYDELIDRLGLERQLSPTLMQAELDLEARLLRTNPQGLRLAEWARDSGLPVVFVSDTYFRHEFITEQLLARKIAGDSDRIFASSDFASSKAGGGLFDVALGELGIPPQSLLHFGDDRHSDLLVPSRRGIRAPGFADGRLNRFEQLLAERRWATSGLAAAFAGASRLARLRVEAQSPHLEAIRDVGAGVAGPLLVSYVLWLIRRAQQLGLERLYFVARDGQVMVEIAERIVKRLGASIEVRYLLASRDSVNLASTLSLSDEEVGWVERDLAHLTPRGILERFDIRWPEVSSQLGAAGICPDTDPDNRQGLHLLALLRESPELRKLVLDRARERRDLATSYLEQIGLLDGIPAGLVDFGGVGSQMRALHILVKEAGGSPPRMFLVGLDRPEDAGLRSPTETPTWLDDTECYLYDHRRNRGIKCGRGFVTCVQMFCAADHGTVINYERAGSGVYARLEEDSDRELLDWGLGTLRESIGAFTDELLLDEDLIDPHADVHEAILATIEAFWSAPTLEEARAWGGFPFEGAQATGAEREPLAYAYTWPLIAHHSARRNFPNFGWMHWYEGSLRLSRPSVRIPLQIAGRTYQRFERSPSAFLRSSSAAFRWLLGR